MKKQLLAGALAMALMAACSQQLKTAAPADMAPSKAMSEAPAPPSASMKSGIDMNNMDTAVRPQDDFFRYVNGNWLKKVEIPADKPSYGAFVALRDKSDADVKSIIEEAARTENKKPGSAAQKVGDLYSSFLNTEQLETLGVTPLNGEFARIDAIAGKKDLAAYFAHVLKLNTNAPFAFWVNNDAKNPTEYVVYLTQHGLGLPDRDYYFNEDDKSVELRGKYVEHVANMLRLAGMTDAEQQAKDVMALETQIAEGHWTRVESRDRDKTYNKVETASLNELVSNFDWNTYLAAAGISDQPFLIVRQPSYYEKLNTVMENTSLDSWKTYFKWHLITNYAGYLNSELDQENFRFYGTVLRGTPEQRERWKRGVAAVNGALGEVVGQIYVQKHFKPAAKARMIELVENLREAYRQSILGLEWMGEETKEQALQKLAKFKPKIGYPDKWRDYSGLDVKADDLAGNVMRSNDFDFAYQLNKLGKPINRDEWFLSPQTVNAYYNPSMNEIVFPAAILHPPFFFMDADDAVNYGAIGGVIGHEMGHGFDDQGSKSDGDGLQRNWWTEQDLEEFKKRTGQLVAQYNAYEPLPGEHINGELTLGENIGDLGGLTIAHKAYLLSLKGKPAPELDGFTGEQRFFLGWGQVWAYKFREEALRQQIKTDPHSPAEFRVNGVMPNMPEFVAAFNVTEGDGMYLPPASRVKIW